MRRTLIRSVILFGIVKQIARARQWRSEGALSSGIGNLSGESFSWLGRLIILYAMKMPAPKAATLFLFYRIARTSGQQIIPLVRVQLSGYNNR